MNDQKDRVLEFFKLLATAHECYPEERTVDGEKFLFFNGTSPDEMTLVDFMKREGIVLSAVSETNVDLRVYPESGMYERNSNDQNSNSEVPD